MAANLTTRQGRQSATSLFVPFMTPGAHPTGTVTDEERVATAWMYTGYDASALRALVSWAQLSVPDVPNTACVSRVMLTIPSIESEVFAVKEIHYLNRLPAYGFPGQLVVVHDDREESRLYMWNHVGGIWKRL